MGGEVSPTARGFGYSIYIMLGLVFGLMATIAGYVVTTIRREEREVNNSKQTG